MIIVHDYRIGEEYIKKIKKVIPGADLYPFGKSNDPYFLNVYESIRNHPDIYFFQLDSRTVIHAKGIPNAEIELLREKGVNLIPGENDPNGRYPHTAGYNAVRVGDFFIHNEDITDPAITRTVRSRNLKTIHVSQGYTRCSVAPVGKNAVITSDEGILKSLIKEGLDVLYVSPGLIKLPGEKHGFVGGASGRLPDGRIVFLGDISLHPDFESVVKFLKKHNTEHLCLKGLPLFDSGSFMIFNV